MHREEGAFPVTLIARILRLSWSGYYAFEARVTAFGDCPVSGPERCAEPG